MTEEQRSAIVLKLKKSRSFLNEADILFQNKFYATKALLLTKDLIPKTHSGVINQLHQHFVQSGEFDMQQASFFSRLMQERIEDDYSDTIKEDAESAEEFIQPTQLYIAYVEELIASTLAKD